MATIISSNILSPLGMTTDETYQAIRAGKSGLHQYPCWKELPFPITASLFAERHGFEELVLDSVNKALDSIDIDKSRAIFILSSTKGAVENLDEGRDVPPLGEIAKRISESCGIHNQPIAVCNACISGVAALILGQRLVDSGFYDYAIVCGADVQSRFIVSGFQSLKALSPNECRPFDIERLGLNLGEAAATVVLAKQGTGWHIEKGAVRNDAYHISAPHPKGDGAYNALNAILSTPLPLGEAETGKRSGIGVIGVHGTATMYNDQMESKALERAELLDIPVSALKGYFGHTMGAAGVIETILTARALDDGIILASRNFETRGVSGKVFLSPEEIKTDKRAFIKMLSGFGGCNGVVLLNRQKTSSGVITLSELPACKNTICITHDGADLGGVHLLTSEHGKALLTELYKQHVGDYPKFYKMDILSRLAFLAAELLLKDMKIDENTAVILFNRTSSIVSDKAYEASIHKDDFFPSPSVFVYTLPNIATGEIAIRHGLKGETSFYILPERDEHLMDQVVKTTFEHDPQTTSAITGWIDAPTEEEFECELKILQLNNTSNINY